MASDSAPSAVPLPPYVPRDVVFRRLQMIFPDGTHNRLFCVREMAASTVFTMLYIGAVERSGVFLAPKHVYRMTREQSALSGDAARVRFRDDAVAPGYAPAGTRWYADNSREGIRDETLREGLMQVGAAFARGDLPTTSGKPRYALRASFAELFDPQLDGEALESAIERFQEATLSKGALARLAIIRHGAARGALGPLVSFPNEETRRLAPGPSSTIAKAVVEVFATRFLRNPAVLWLSESGKQSRRPRSEPRCIDRFADRSGPRPSRRDLGRLGWRGAVAGLRGSCRY
jgi:BsuBI/PstI restriction endonuclease HTH domain/BsuBI/PstI restriction endonuclease domain